MDNSPLWDEALGRINPTADEIPDYQRVDVELADPFERPTDGEYDRYVYLVGLFRELDYRPDRIPDATPFALQSVLFNSLLVQSNRDLAQIRAAARQRPDYEAWARLTAAGIDAAVERGGRALRRLRPRSGEARRRPDRGRSVSAPRRDSDGRASAADGRQARRVPRRGQRRESWAVTSSGRPGLPAGEVLAARSGRSSTGRFSAGSTGKATERSPPRFVEH